MKKEREKKAEKVKVTVGKKITGMVDRILGALPDPDAEGRERLMSAIDHAKVSGGCVQTIIPDIGEYSVVSDGYGTEIVPVEN
ncbi:MAG TPA: hypothetical protein VI819_05695 [Patescibacteria group bacterium]|nr:hypothetical protein [Patescibacteria group bacterium]